MRKMKRLSAIVMAVLLLSMTVIPSTAFAAQTNELVQDETLAEAPIVTYAVNQVTIYDYWVTVKAPPASSSTGLNRWVTFSVSNMSSAHTNDIRMFNKNGQEIWAEQAAIPHSGSRSFWCGSDVYRVDMRVRSVNILGNLSPRTAVVNVQD